MIGQVQVANFLGYARMSTVEMAEPPLQLLQNVALIGRPPGDPSNDGDV